VHGVKNKPGDQENSDDDRSQHDSTLQGSARHFSDTGQSSEPCLLRVRDQSLGGTRGQLWFVRLLAGVQPMPKRKHSSEAACIAVIHGRVALCPDVQSSLWMQSTVRTPRPVSRTVNTALPVTSYGDPLGQAAGS